MAGIEKNDLLEEFLCGICCKLYGSEVSPEILLCGHTYCRQCILQLETTTKLCPTCRTPMSGELSSIKNFSHLNIVTQLKDEFFNETCAKELENMKTIIINNKGILTKSRDKQNKQLKILDTLLSRVNNLLKNPESPVGNAHLESMKDIKTTLLTIHKERTQETKFTPKIFADPSNDPCSFLLKIYKKGTSGGNLLTVHLPNYESGFKYGKISTWSNNLYFHCLTLDDPGDCLEFIKFDDLKMVIASKKINTSHTFRPFMELLTGSKVEHHITITAMNSILTPQFIRLCTGESGTSYVGAEYEYKKSDPCIVLKGFTDESEGTFRIVDYCPDTYELITVPRLNQYVILGSRNGGFKIFYSSENLSIKDCVGRIEHPHDLLANVYKSGKIVGCGISFKVF